MTPREEERAAIIAYLRGGGDYFRGVWHGWDSEMRSYAEGFADMLESRAHLTETGE